MTNQELNRDIKRLWNELYRMSFQGQDEYLAYRDGAAKKEFMRLYHADSEMTAMNLTSVKMMLRMNLSHRFIQLHTFGLHIKI